MQRTPLSGMACSIAQTLDVAGEWWTPLIVRDIYIGLSRFEQIRDNLGVSRKVLTARLDTLRANGVVERHPYQEKPTRYDYVLTEKGRDLMVAVLALMAWGDKWSAPNGLPVLIEHRGCGQLTRPQVSCSNCGDPLDADAIDIGQGPGARSGSGTRQIAQALKRRARGRAQNSSTGQDNGEPAANVARALRRPYRS
jgi:DNA-binding HxlR family transcriptional regulator